jgi:hypothetical protein
VDGSEGAGAGRRGGGGGGAGGAAEGIELGELRGAAAARAAVVRGLAAVPLDALAALSPEQLAKRLRKEVEGLVGTEDASPDDLWFVHALHSVDLLASLAVVVLWMRKSYVHVVERWVMTAEWALCAFFLVNYTLRLLRAGLAPSAAASAQVRAHRRRGRTAPRVDARSPPLAPTPSCAGLRGPADRHPAGAAGRPVQHLDLLLLPCAHALVTCAPPHTRTHMHAHLTRAAHAPPPHPPRRAPSARAVQPVGVRGA